MTPLTGPLTDSTNYKEMLSHLKNWEGFFYWEKPGKFFSILEKTWEGFFIGNKPGKVFFIGNKFGKVFLLEKKKHWKVFYWKQTWEGVLHWKLGRWSGLFNIDQVSSP